MVALKYILFSNIILGFMAENSWVTSMTRDHRYKRSPGREQHLPAQQKHQDQRKWVTTQFPRTGVKQKGQQVRLRAAAINVKGPETGWHIACVRSASDDSQLCLLMLTDYLIEPRHKLNVSKQLEKWRSRFDVADTYNCLVRKTKLAKDTPNRSHRRKSHPLWKPQHTKDWTTSWQSSCYTVLCEMLDFSTRQSWAFCILPAK